MPSKRAPTASNIKQVSLLLRIGLAIVFAYAAISAFRQPEAWLSFVPTFTTKFIAAKVSLDVISIIQLVLALVLLSGKYLKYATSIAIVFLAGIIVFNLNSLVITFRDFGLIFMALALFILDTE